MLPFFACAGEEKVSIDAEIIINAVSFFIRASLVKHAKPFGPGCNNLILPLDLSGQIVKSEF